MNKEYIYTVICELAEADGLDPRDYVDQLYAEKTYQHYDGLPAEVEAELEDSRRSRSRARYDVLKSERVRSDIEAFRRVFPSVVPDEIPESVWSAVAEGVPLAAAYALYEKEASAVGELAKQVNETNAAARADGAAQYDFITAQQLENMTPAEVKSNYRRIIDSMKKRK